MAAKKKTEVVAAEMTCKVSDWDQYLFGQGNHYEIYKKLGAHLTTKDGKKGTYFAVWAPRAVSVSVVGDFNKWDVNAHIMNRLEGGIHELFIPGVKVGDLYKYAIRQKDYSIIYKSDPYGTAMEMRPNNASIVYDVEKCHQWQSCSKQC